MEQAEEESGPNVGYRESQYFPGSGLGDLAAS